MDILDELKEIANEPLDPAILRMIDTSFYEGEPSDPELEKEVTPYPDPLPEEAYHGIAGDIIRKIEPHTEADKVALLGSFVVAVGNIIKDPYIVIAERPVRTNFDMAFVGDSARGRKGTSWGYIENLVEAVDLQYKESNILSGLSSGEGLIYAVRNAVFQKKPVYEGKGKDKFITGYTDEMTDEGVSDKRKLIIEEELARPLKAMNREQNTLSTIIRNAWDCKDLQIMTKSTPYKASKPYISILGHITRYELLKNLTDTDALNGFANRFIWLTVKRSKILPFPSSEINLNNEIIKLKDILQWAKLQGEIRLSEEVKKDWGETIYPMLTREQGTSLTACILARSEAQVLKLALFYAIMDKSNYILLEHLAAALAIWQYAEASANFIFGTVTEADPTEQKILEGLQKYKELTQTEIGNIVFSKHTPASTIKNALQSLSAKGKVESRIEETTGRNKTIWKLKSKG